MANRGASGVGGGYEGLGGWGRRCAELTNRISYAAAEDLVDRDIALPEEALLPQGRSAHTYERITELLKTRKGLAANYGRRTSRLIYFEVSVNPES